MCLPSLESRHFQQMYRDPLADSHAKQTRIIYNFGSRASFRLINSSTKSSAEPSGEVFFVNFIP